MMIPIDKMSTTDKVIESIRSYIQEPGRNPGEKLPTENELGKQLGVGRRLSARRCACCRRWAM